MKLVYMCRTGLKWGGGLRERPLIENGGGGELSERPLAGKNKGFWI